MFNAVPLADGMHRGDIGEEMMVFSCGHSLPQSLAVFEMPHQDAQAVQVRVLGCHDLENGLHECTERCWLERLRCNFLFSILEHLNLIIYFISYLLFLGSNV